MKKYILAVALLMASAAQARNVWRECGIGGMLFKDAKYSWAAVGSNIIWDLGTTATSSNISSDDLCEGSKTAVANFVHENFARLEEQTAVGSGVQLDAVLSKVSCDQASKTQILSGMRQDLSKNVSAKEYNQKSNSEKAEVYYNQLMNNASKHSTQCQKS